MLSKKVERPLKVELTDQEIAERSRAMATIINDKVRLKGEAKYKAEGYAATIKLLEQQIEAEASIIETGHEFRPVACEEREASNGIEVEVVRLDTSEVVSTRPKTDEERQQCLFEEVKTKFDSDKIEEPIPYKEDDDDNNYEARGANEHGVYLNHEIATVFRSKKVKLEIIVAIDPTDHNWRSSAYYQSEYQSWGSLPSVHSEIAFTRDAAITCEIIKQKKKLKELLKTEQIAAEAERMGKILEAIEGKEGKRPVSRNRKNKLIQHIEESYEAGL